MNNPRRKWGDVREDGYIFRGYKKNGGEQWQSKSYEHSRRLHHALHEARKRAAFKNLPFDITFDYLKSIYPADSKCPALSIEMVWGGGESGSRNSPSLDRTVPAKGYVKGNVVWMSLLANSIKSDATPDQVIRVGEYLKGTNCS